MTKSEQAAIAKTAEFIETKFRGEGTGHDWWHMQRVLHLARHIASKEQGVNLFIVELGALLHDIADWKFHDGNTKVGPKQARDWLASIHVDDAVIKDVEEIVEHISYRGGTNTHIMSTIEGKIVQDADRLDGIGAMGICRVFAFGGQIGREFYNPDKPPRTYKNFDEFRQGIPDNTGINYFYEKLLVIKDKMNTPTGRAMAEHRHKYMEAFLEEFYAEWDGKL